MNSATSKANIQAVDLVDSASAGLSVRADLAQKAAAKAPPVRPQTGGMSLADLANGIEARVLAVDATHPGVSADLGRRLAELGFLPGEKLRIVARGLFGREPIAVRIGTGTFALRLFEAACIRVSPEPSQAC